MLSPNPPERKDGRQREKTWSKGLFSFCQEVKRRRILFGLFMPNGMSISFEMQPLLLREQNVNACASFVHTTRCKIQRGTRTHVVHREHVDEAARGAVAEVGFARTYVVHRDICSNVIVVISYWIRTYLRECIKKLMKTIELGACFGFARTCVSASV